MIFKSAKYALGLLIVLQFSSPQSFAQNTIFAKFDALTCQGAMDRDFPGSAVFSIGFGGTAVPGAAGGGIGAGRSMFADIKLVKTLDDCTPLLFQNLAKGARLNTVNITIVTPATADTPARALLKIVLDTVFITSDEFTEAVGGRPAEVVTLSWQKITITYMPTGTRFGWDKLTNSTF
jgi:type VI protein secretion system component Hcp